ncbi:hypothetical protein H0H87_000425 [Tephrocybe sp. NHM501043]|nr:hypothetical protein H0H87_000425 [Tephrocybe sp. NHM501043]
MYAEALDAFGPLDALNTLAKVSTHTLKLFVIAATLDPVSTKPPSFVSPTPIAFSESIVPTHTFETAPQLDVLIVPGGWGIRDPDAVQGLADFIAKVYPSLKYLISVCTGAVVVAKAGVLDGKRATTNKRSWEWATSSSEKVEWVARARWVVDGNIWTSSGVSAGIDVIFAWIKEVYGENTATEIANILEYERHTDPSWDPFSDLYDLLSPSEG